MIDLKGKTAFVTGGSRGIGKAIVISLLQAGANVCFTHVSKGSGEILNKEIQEMGLSCSSYQGDVADFEQMEEITKQVIDKHGNVDILVNNAGITRDNLLMRMSQQEWNEVIQTNLTGVFNVCKSLMRPMMKARSGRIINITSVVAHKGNPGQVNYCASKSGIIGFTKSLAMEVASRNITCNAIAPGFIATDMTSDLTDAQKNIILNNIPMKKLGASQDIANGVLFLSSPMADYITGTTLHINGGLF